MRMTILPVLIAPLLFAACADSRLDPTFELLFPSVRGELLTNSSPSLVDLDGDGVLDIVYGTGVDRLQPQDGRWRLGTEPAIAGYVTAVSGRTNQILWRAPHSGEAFTTPRFAALNGDDRPDVVMGGRQGSMSAFSGRDGALLWRVDPARIAVTPVLYNFFTPAQIADANGDGVTDLVVAYGGNDTRLPGEARDPGFIVALSGADGSVLAVHQTPDSAETYSSIIAYPRADGTTWMVFGTGGERQNGAAWRAPVASLLDGTFGKRVERLVPPLAKGVMAPATLVELTGDRELDIAISTFDGRLIVLDGASGKTLWERQDAREETYHPPAVVRIGKDGALGLFVSRGIGVFPKYAGTAHRLLDARDGRMLYEHKGLMSPAGAPLAVDLTGDGIDEPFFFDAPGRIHVLHLASKALVIHDAPGYFTSTPHIADPRDNGTLELIGLSWTNASDDGRIANWRNLHSEMLRMDLSADVPAFRAWAAYMGTAMDGQYHTTGPGAR
jgi:outer membrane protein assembly factor BamB